MKAKTKLIATLMAMCLVITLGVFGILAVKTLNMSVGGNITFTADGIAFEVSKGEFKTTSGSEYTGITAQTGKLQAFAMNTNTKLADVQDKINSWAGLDLVATESLGDPVLHFSITNLMEDEILSFNPTITLGTNINDNMEILISPKVANIQATQSQNFTITFHVKDTSINAGLTGENYSGFAINILLSTALVAEPSEMPQMTFAPTTEGATTYKISDCSTATGDVVIPAFVKQQENIYPVTEIADYAFLGNTNISSVVIPNTITKIGNSAFSGCVLNCEITIPNSIEIIDAYAFSYCGLNGELVIPNSVTKIGNYAFEKCKGLTKLTFGNSLTSIGEYAFDECSGITGQLLLPNSLKSIGHYAFRKCYKISGELIIPDSVTTLGGASFNACVNLTSIIVGNGISNTGAAVFANCTSLTSITFKNKIPPTKFGEGCFRNTNECPIYVPSEEYKNANNLATYADRMIVI